MAKKKYGTCISYVYKLTKNRINIYINTIAYNCYQVIIYADLL